MTIDLDRSVDLIRRERPKVIVLGASFFLFPQPVREIAKEIRRSDTVLVYDGSHVLGLIAGRQFQNPLKEGADILIGSTHKSFFGPQGGMILAGEEAGEIIKNALFPGLIDNAHWNRIAALSMALAEARRFGVRYAAQVIRNAQALGRALSHEKLPVSFKDQGFTRSHQVFLDFGGYKKGHATAAKLERANIITDSGVRLGTNEVTRWGMKEPEMAKIAALIGRALTHRQDPASVRKDVLILRKSFPRLEYCFEEESAGSKRTWWKLLKGKG
jgi:glycine hydroxymethyltransferase